MKVKYFDFGGDPQEVTGEQFYENYNEGKVPPNQTVLANGEPMEIERLIYIIEDAEDAWYLKAARKAKLEEEQFQKTAPWWLKKWVRFAVNWSLVAAVPYCFTLEGGGRLELVLYVVIPYLVYMVGGGNRYDGVCDMVLKDQYQFAITEIEKRREKRRLKYGDDTDGRKDHG